MKLRAPGNHGSGSPVPVQCADQKPLCAVANMALHFLHTVSCRKRFAHKSMGTNRFRRLSHRITRPIDIPAHPQCHSHTLAHSAAMGMHSACHAMLHVSYDEADSERPFDSVLILQTAMAGMLNCILLNRIMMQC